MEDTQGLSMVQLLPSWCQCLCSRPCLHSSVSTLGDWIYRRSLPKRFVIGPRPVVGCGHSYELCGWHVVQVARTCSYPVRRSDGNDMVWRGEHLNRHVVHEKVRRDCAVKESQKWYGWSPFSFIFCQRGTYTILTCPAFHIIIYFSL